jgi:hypothetical protein
VSVRGHNTEKKIINAKLPKIIEDFRDIDTNVEKSSPHKKTHHTKTEKIVNSYRIIKSQYHRSLSENEKNQDKYDLMSIMDLDDFLKYEISNNVDKCNYVNISLHSTKFLDSDYECELYKHKKENHKIHEEYNVHFYSNKHETDTKNYDDKIKNIINHTNNIIIKHGDIVALVIDKDTIPANNNIRLYKTRYYKVSDSNGTKIGDLMNRISIYENERNGNSEYVKMV